MGNTDVKTAGAMRQHYAVEALLTAQSGDKLIDEKGSAHQLMVGRVSALLARTLGIEIDKAAEIGQAARLRDIGLTCLPPMLAKSHRALNPAEQTMFQQHPLQGARLLSLYDGPFFNLAATICKYAHERVDGSGWPDGIHGRFIPLEAKIVIVASVYVELRTGVDNHTHNEAVMALTCGGGAYAPEQFDDQVLWALVEAGKRLDNLIAQ